MKGLGAYIIIYYRYYKFNIVCIKFYEVKHQLIDRNQ